MTRQSPIVTDTALSSWTATGLDHLLPSGGRTQPNLEPDPGVDRGRSMLSSWVGEGGGDRFETVVWYKTAGFFTHYTRRDRDISVFIGPRDGC